MIVKGHMRTFPNILGIGLVAVFIIGFVWFVSFLVNPNPQYFGLQHKSAKYYADFTAACDSVLAEHPLGTNEAIKIPVTDPSLPKIITGLRPIRIQVSPQRVWMILGSDSHAGFGLAWEPQMNDTNVWVLHTIAEGLDTVIYSSKR